jgi:hypothetical protein
LFFSLLVTSPHFHFLLCIGAYAVSLNYFSFLCRPFPFFCVCSLLFFFFARRFATSARRCSRSQDLSFSACLCLRVFKRSLVSYA